MPELRRVYAVCAEVPPEVTGGLGRYAERMMGALRGLGTPVEVFGMTSRRGAAGTEYTGDATLHRVRTVGANGRLARIAGVLVFNVVVAARILRTDRSGSVVAVHDWMGCLAGILCRLLGRRPVVFHVHTRERREGWSLVATGIAALETAQSRLARLVVVPSAGMRDGLAACGWPADRLRVIPHGFEDAALPSLTTGVRDAVRRRYLPGDEGSLVVFAGRLSPHKGVRTLLLAVPHVLRAHPRARFVLIGAGAPRTRDNAEVARLIDALGIAASVTAGYRFLDPPEVFAHFLAADVCAFPSTYEPFGLVAVEAMALARPVVVGPGYSPEVVGDGAIRCRDDAPEELAAALLRCLDDPEAAARLGARGAAHVRARFRWQQTATLTLAAYAEVVR